MAFSVFGSYCLISDENNLQTVKKLSLLPCVIFVFMLAGMAYAAAAQ